MRGDELRDTGVLAGTTLDEIAVTARDMHAAIAGRLFGLAGRPGAAIKLAHDGIAAIAYTSTRAGVKYGPRAIGAIAGALQDPAAESVHDDRRGRFTFGALGGVVGDRMAAESSAVAPQMRLRLGNGPLRRVADNVAQDAAIADPPVGNRLVIFVHGLCETDLCWSFAAERRWGDRKATYGSKLQADDGWTPLYLNFNTGLHISQNALELAEQLEELVAGWPVPVSDIAIVGHSLGGLVARSAANQADALGHRWVESLRHIVGLGTPHLGAPLERFANRGTRLLARLPETRPLANLINQRSVGIKDLRHGALVEADWLDFEPDDVADNCTPAVLVPGVRYSMVSATLSHQPEGVFAMDLLVQHGSAHGIGTVRSIPFDTSKPDHFHTIAGGKHHFDLLADASVYDKVRGWLGESAVTDPRRRSTTRSASRSTTKGRRRKAG